MSAGSVFAFLPPPPPPPTTASTQSQRSSGAAPISAFPRKGKEQEVRS